MSELKTASDAIKEHWTGKAEAMMLGEKRDRR